MDKKVEIISQSVKDAINAQKGGANRVELVCALSEGGLTPSYAMVESVLENTNIEVAVMIRPTSKTFCYDRHYLDVMKKDAEKFQSMGVERLVLGILDKDGNVDIESLDYVLENIDKSKVTFHRAIDESTDILKSVEMLNSYEKVTHILTSGGIGKAMDNLNVIKKMIEISRPRIMIGSGLSLGSVSNINNKFKDVENLFDIHFGTYVQNENGEVDENKVKVIVNFFLEKKRQK